MRERNNNLAQLRRLVLEITRSEQKPNHEALVAFLLLFAGKLIEQGNFAAGENDQVGVNIYRKLAKVTPPDILSSLPDAQSVDKKLVIAIWQKLNQPKMQSLFQDESYLGYIYQFFSTGLRKGIHPDLEKGNKNLSHEQLVAFTQLYTPDWVVDFLLQSTVEPTAKKYSNLPDSKLPDSKLIDFKLIDPACGAGHFLVRALALIFDLHKRNGETDREAVQKTIATNLFGADIDPMALWVCSLVLLTKCIRLGVDDVPQLNLVSVKRDTTSGENNLLGSLSSDFASDHILKQQYDVVVTNPPYIGRKLLDRDLKAQLKRLYPSAHHDLCAAFIARGIELLKPGGRLGLIGQASILYLPSYEDLRRELIEKTNLISIVEAGPGVFPLHGGEKVNSALLVIANQPARESDFACFVDLTSLDNKAEMLHTFLREKNRQFNSHVYFRNQRTFLFYDKYSFNYRCPDVVLKLMKVLPPLSMVSDVRQGLATTDNKRFVRYWKDVDASEIGKRWFPYIKGGGSQRWLGTIEYVVNWQDNGAEIKKAVQAAYPYLKGKIKWVVKNEEFYFRQGLTFSFVNAGDFAVRRMPAGCIFDVGGSAIFPLAEEDQDFLLAFLNSTFARAIARVLNPTVNMQVGDLKRLPVVEANKAEKQQLRELADGCCQILEWLLRFDQARLGRFTPQEVLEAQNGADCKSLWQKYSITRQEQLLKLEEMEKTIDKLIFSIISRQAKLTKEETDQLNDWLSNHQAEQRLNAPGPNDFETFERLIEELCCEILASRTRA